MENKGIFMKKITMIAVFIGMFVLKSGFAEEVFDHSLFGEVLDKFEFSGNVDYAALKNDPGTFNDYLKKVAELSPEKLNAMTDNEKIAFYINAYNAYTIKAIIDHYPVKSIKDIKGVWNKLKFRVAGREMTLDEIEHGTLRKEFKEPRIHFAVNCASIGCPVLRGVPYTGTQLDDMLDDQTRIFINNPSKNRYDYKKNILYISPVFKWFKGDFGNVRIFISKFVPKEQSRQILTNEPKIKYTKYDWALNDSEK